MFVSKFDTNLTPAQTKLVLAMFPTAASGIDVAIVRDPAVVPLLDESCRIVVTQASIHQHGEWPTLSLVTLDKDNAAPYAVGLWAREQPGDIPSFDEVLREGARLKGSQIGFSFGLGAAISSLIAVWLGCLLLFGSQLNHAGPMVDQEARLIPVIFLSILALATVIGFLASYRTKRRLFSAAMV